ncbi:MAG TPA: efflux RND transporter periplasmic adaptor subunit [Blastocatellia bacterium]|nr:efflux RND transporter periplasmic adaptor subunit [Blastocatellia bacterium]
MPDQNTETLNPERAPRFNRRLAWFVAAALTLAIASGLYFRLSGQDAKPNEKAAVEEHSDEKGEGGEVELSPEAMESAKIEYATATERPAVALLRVTGTVEANQQHVQQVTPLVGGRVDRVLVALGDRVRAGAPLAVVASPQIAEMHGKLHESETRLQNAERNLARVQKAENRAAALSAKARLDEAEANLKRTRRLIELGAGAGKDLISAETAYKTAKAEYDFQSNISLNKELAEAQAEVATARVDTQHTRDGLRALGAPVSANENEKDCQTCDISLVTVRAPISGTVIERLINAGAGIEAGKPLFTIADISTLWIIANVPEAQVGGLRVGTPAEARAAARGEGVIAGRVAYIDPVLNEETRTARVRVEVTNRQERLKVGMFVEVGFEAGSASTGGSVEKELVIPEEAVQRINERTVVFAPKKGEAGHFEARDVELGGAAGGYQRVISGLKSGERIVGKGSFTLKTQLLKGEMGDHGH